MPTKPDTIHEFVRSRRTIRKFKPKSVPEGLIHKILETANTAPSAHNLQPWRFAVIKTPEARKELAVVLTDKMQKDMSSEGTDISEIERRKNSTLHRLAEAPTIILLCRDTTAVRDDKPEEKVMAIQSVSNAGLTLLLAVHAEGLGGNWICWPLYAQEETQQALHLPQNWEPQAMFLIGYPAEDASPKPTVNPQNILER